MWQCVRKRTKALSQRYLFSKLQGLTKVLGPTRYCDGGQSWDLAYKLIWEVVKGDSSLGMLLGYHLLWNRTLSIVGTDEQNDRIQKLIVGDNLLVAVAANPWNGDQKITDAGDHIIFNGFKHFNTGGVTSDLTVLEEVISYLITLNGFWLIVDISTRRYRQAHLHHRTHKSTGHPIPT